MNRRTKAHSWFGFVKGEHVFCVVYPKGRTATLLAHLMRWVVNPELDLELSDVLQLLRDARGQFIQEEASVAPHRRLP